MGDNETGVRYTIDSAASMVTIRARSSVHPITVTVAPTGHVFARRTQDGGLVPQGGRIEVAATELRSGNPLVDRETKRRIDARRHPTLTGEMTELIGVEARAATVQGVIEFLGESVLVEGDVTMGEPDGRTWLRGEGTLDVRWWGLEPPKLLALKVYPEIAVYLELELLPSEEGE